MWDNIFHIYSAFLGLYLFSLPLTRLKVYSYQMDFQKYKMFSLPQNIEHVIRTKLFLLFIAQSICMISMHNVVEVPRVV